MSRESDYLTIGRVRKTQGRRGEIAVEVLTDFPDRFQPGNKIRLSNGPTSLTLIVEESWSHKGMVILKFQGYDSISAAETLVGYSLEIPQSERQTLPQGTFYLSDLIGCELVQDGESLGKVEAIEETGAVPLLRVVKAGAELLVPFAQEICVSINVAEKKIEVRLPEGLREL